MGTHQAGLNDILGAARIGDRGGERDQRLAVAADDLVEGGVVAVAQEPDEAVVGLRREGAACNRFQRNRHRSFIIVTVLSGSSRSSHAHVSPGTRTGREDGHHPRDRRGDQYGSSRIDGRHRHGQAGWRPIHPTRRCADE